MEIQESLKILDLIVKPDQINDLQELVFKECWEGKTYQEISEMAGYEHDYIRGIGAQLWKLLSKKLDTKISKHNFKKVIREYEENKLKNIHVNNNHSSNNNLILEVPEGAIPLNSQFYIERYPIEKQCYEEIVKPGALILLKAPSLFGKTSLKKRIIAFANQFNYSAIKINFEQVDKSLFNNINKFLRSFCASIAKQLNIKPNLDDYWDEDLGSKSSCTDYLENYVLSQINNPIIIALDNLHILFEYPQITNDFLPLLRFWYEEAKDIEIWQKLRFIVIYATDIYVPLNINQSPFNVGLSFRLPEFTESQINTLAEKYQLSPENKLNFIPNLMKLVGGNPYLIRLGIYHLQQGQISGNQLLETGATLSGIYNEHLLSQWKKLQTVPELLNSLKKIVNIDQAVQLEPIIAHKLESMGIVKFIGDFVIPSCDLYQVFFSNQLKNREN